MSHLPSPGSPGSCVAFPQHGSACYPGSTAWSPGCCSCAPVYSSGQYSTVRSGPGTAETQARCDLNSHRGNDIETKYRSDLNHNIV